MGDESLLTGLRNGDNKAYNFLYEHYYKSLCIYAFRIVADHHSAENVVNDVIFSLYKNRDNLSISDIKAYLTRSVRNGAINLLLKQRKHVSISIDSLTDSIDITPSLRISGSTPLDHLLAKELNDRILASIACLPPLTREIFRLSRYGDLKYDDIAEVLSISADVVKYHIKRALAHLRSELKEYFY